MTLIGWRCLGGLLDIATTMMLWVAVPPIWIARQCNRGAKASHRKACA